MSRRKKDRIIFRTPSPGIRQLDEPTSPPPAPRPERVKHVELQKGINPLGRRADLPMRLTSISSTAHSPSSNNEPTTSSSPSEIHSPQSSSSPQVGFQSNASSSPSSNVSSPLSTSSSLSQRSYPSSLYHLYDITDYHQRNSESSGDNSGESSSTYHSTSKWDIIASPTESQRSSPCNSPAASEIIIPTTPPPLPLPPPAVPASRSPSSQPSPSSTISTTSNTLKSSETYLNKRQSEQKRRGSSSPHNTQTSPRRSPNPLYARMKSTTSVESDTSEEEVEEEIKARRLWMARLRPRGNANTNVTAEVSSRILNSKIQTKRTVVR